MSEFVFLKLDATNFRDKEGNFSDTYVSNRGLLNVNKITAISIVSVSANFKSYKNYDKVVQLFSNYSLNYVWNSDGSARMKRHIPIATVHLQQVDGCKYFCWNNPLNNPWIPVTSPCEIMQIFCKDVFKNKSVKDNIEVSILVNLKICK